MSEKTEELRMKLEQTRAELRSCETSLCDIMTKSVHGVLIVGNGGTIHFANPVAAAILRCSEQKLPGKRFEFPIVTGETKELQLKFDNGTTTAVEMLGVETEWDGKPAHVVTLHDVTEHKKKEQELRKLYRAVMESPSSVMITDARGSIEYVNPKFTNISGYTFAEAVGRNPRFLKSGKVPPETYKEMWETITRGEEWRGEMINRKKDGELYHESVSIAPVSDFEGNITNFIAVTEDITERKRAEEALLFSEARYRALFRDNPTMIAILDTDWRMLTVNPVCASLLGYTIDELEGQPVLKIFHEEDRPAVAEQLRTCLQNPNQVYRWQFRKIRKDGGLLWVEELAQTVYDLNGELNIIVVCQDITERKRMEGEIERLNTNLAARAAELETANIELETFNYSVSHDLRKPLTIINSYCQVILELCGGNLDEQCRDYIQEMYSGTLRMNRLIDVLLDFSRLTHVELHRENIDLSGIAREVAAELNLTAPERRVLFRIAEGITTNGDANLLRVVLDNLIDNAWKYTSKREEAVIEFGVTEIEGNRVYFLRDNGAGFDMANAEHLFLPFQRLPGTDEFKGHGIGLATVQRIVSRHGGKVWAEGVPDRGATFYFTLSA